MSEFSETTDESIRVGVGGAKERAPAAATALLKRLKSAS